MLASAPTPSKLVAGTVLGALKSNNIPGAQLGVIRDGKALIDDGYGVASLKTKVPVTPRTRFEIGSLTKQFTAAAILQLKEQRKLHLSDALGKYVPEYQRGRNVTIEQLLWQVSGIPDYMHDDNIAQIASTRRGGIEAALSLIKNRPLHFQPGSRWEYSNTNYLLLGAIVARVSHMSWEAYLRKNLFARAGMTATAFLRDERTMVDAAVGYSGDRSGVLHRPPPLREGWAGGAGAIVSTVGDLAKWDEAFFSGKVVDAADERLATTAHRLPSGDVDGYGFGWAIDSFEGQTRIWHNGSTFGFSSISEYFPELHEAVVVFINTADATPLAISSPVFDELNPEIAAAARRPVGGESRAITAIAREWLGRIQSGSFARWQLTPQANNMYTPVLIKRLEKQFAPLGRPQSLVYRGKQTIASEVVYTYLVRFKEREVMFYLGLDRDNKITGMYIGRVD